VTISLTGRLQPVANPRRRTNRHADPDPTVPRPADRRALNGILQHLIQPARPAATATHGLRITARCAGAQPGLDIGGDWYLSSVLPDGDLVFAVGDVAGHGLAASPDMLQLRNAMTAFAVEGHAAGDDACALLAQRLR
jgi:Stage II sporulation protein E (SpoIIE)